MSPAITMPYRVGPMPVFGFSPRLAVPLAASEAASPPSAGLWQSRVLFGNKGLTPDAFKVLQTWAREKRAAMPLLHQAMYPLNGERVGIEQMTGISQAMAADPRLAEWPLSRQEELRLLSPLILYERLLGDPSNQVQFQTVFLADRINQPDAQALLINRAIGHPDYRTRNYVFYISALQQALEGNNTDVLDMANDFHPWVRYQLARMLPGLPDTPKREQVIRQLIQDEIGYVKGSAAAQAHLLKDEEEGQRIILEALNSTDRTVQQNALPGIARLKDPAEMTVQIRRALKEDPASAKTLAGMQEHIKDPVLWNEIVQAMAQSDDSETRVDAIPLLTDEAQREQLVMELTAMETGPYASWAVYKLEGLPEPLRNRYLRRLASDPNPVRRKASLSMLHRVQSEPLKKQVVRKLLRDPDEAVRRETLLYVSNLEPSKTLDRIILGALHSDDPQDRKQAAWALRQLSDPEQRLIELLRLLKDADAEVRQNAIRVLDAVEAPEVRNGYLRQFMRDSDPEIRLQTVFNKDWLQWDPAARDEAIRHFSDDPAVKVREYLPYAIGELLSEQLGRFLESPYPKLLDEAVRRMDPETPLAWRNILPAWILLLQSGADGTRLKDALQGYREFVGHAMTHRERFTQEGQKPLNEETMAHWLRQTASYAMTAVMLLGPDAVKGKFDEKALKFHQFLIMVQTLGNHPRLGPEFYNTLRSGGRGAYPAWQANRALEILYGLLLLNKPDDAMAIMMDIRQHRRINLADYQERFLKKLGEVAGLSPEAFERPDIQQRLARWTDPYIFTIGSALNTLEENSQKILMDIVEADLNNRVPEFLTDESKPWGEANKRTREIFEANGLDYGQWLGYDKPVTVELGGRELEISLWDRDPARDLFIGSHSRTCLALDTRPEEMLDAFLNTMAQYAMIRDKQTGDPVGYIRMFWALPETGEASAKPELVIDNVAYAFEQEDPNAGKLLGIATRYAREFGRAVTNGREPEIFLSRYIHTIPKEHVRERPIQVLGSSRTGNYYLFAVDQYLRSSLDKPLVSKVVPGGMVMTP